MYTFDSPTIAVGTLTSDGSSNTTAIVARPSTGNWSNTSEIKGQVTFEIAEGQAFQGLSKGAVLQTVKASATSNDGQTVLNNAPIIFEDEVYDVGSNYDNTTGLFTAPSTGYYHVSSAIALSSTVNCRIAISINGTFEKRGPVNSAGYGSVSGDVYVQAGDTISVENNVGSSVTLFNDTTFNFLTISRISDDTGNLPTGAGTSEMADDKARFLVPNYQTYTLSLSSDGAQNMTGDIVFIKIGNTVTYTSDGVISHDSSNTPVSTSTIPADFRPSSNIYNTYRYSETAGFTAIINSAGTLSLQYRNETTTVNQTSTGTAINGSYIII
jgi:hypothetical protein